MLIHKLFRCMDMELEISLLNLLMIDNAFMQIHVIWNTLPVNVVSASTVQSFRHKLKSFLFDQSFPN